MSDARIQLQTAVRDALLRDPVISGTSGVFDRVPNGTAHPFLAVGDVASEPLDGDADGPVEHTFAVIVFSRGEGRREASDLAERVRMALDRALLTMADHRLIGLRVRDVDVRSSRDLRAFQARVRLRAVTEPI